MGRPNLVTVWELKLSLALTTSGPELEELDLKIGQVGRGEHPTPFIWERRGAVVTVRTESDPLPLMEIAEWALMRLTTPMGFEVRSIRTAPLASREG